MFKFYQKSGHKALGQRLDNTKAALERCIERLAQAHESLTLAKKAVDCAAEEESSLVAELQSLESQATQSQPAPEVTSLVTLEGQLHSAVEQLRQINTLQPSVADDAQAQAATLLARFRTTIDAAQKMCVAQSLPLLF